MGKWSDPWTRSSLEQQAVRMLDKYDEENTRSIVFLPQFFGRQWSLGARGVHVCGAHEVIKGAKRHNGVWLGVQLG
jgi:hypothetical protein